MEQQPTRKLLTKEAARRLVTERYPYFPAADRLLVEEIGDGNINYVFRIRDRQTGKSLILKQADTFLRSSGRALSTKRNQIEAAALKMHANLSPGDVPELYVYDTEDHVLVMEDVSDYQNLRHVLAREEQVPAFAKRMSQFLSRTLFLTTDLCWEWADKKRLVAEFTNEAMCDISEDLVFTEPYTDYKGQNQLSKGNEEFVAREIYHDTRLHEAVVQLRERYMNYPQGLVHGDLHTGSIFVQPTGIKVLDPEFAFYGPIGYDIGNVLAHLTLALVHSHFFGKSIEFRAWLSETIADIYDGVLTTMAELYHEQVTDSLYQLPAFKAHYLATIGADAIGYAGTEIIRRVIGDSQVPEVAEAPVGDTRLKMERTMLRIGKQWICQRQALTTGAALQAHVQTVIWEEE